MITLTLNNTTFTITAYNRYTNIDEGGIRTIANVSFPNNSQYDALTQVGEIESITIAMDGTTIYSLPEMEARVTNINEFITEQGMEMDAQIAFEIVTE